jgi:hypothetical protein
MQWPTFAEWVQIVVAFTAGAVALATFRLASRTHSLADETTRVAAATEREAEAVAAQSQLVTMQLAATREQVGLSREALSAAIRPWLTRPTDVEPRVHSPRTGSSDLTVVLWLRNVGTGIALIPSGRAVLRGRARGDGFVQRPGHVDQPALPPGENARITFVVRGHDVDPVRFLSQDRSSGELWATVGYTDVSGELPPFEASVHFAAKHPDEVEWGIVSIDHFEPDETEPFIQVRFDAAIG